MNPLRTTQAYDSHCNLVLGDVEETIYIVDDEDDEDVKVGSSLSVFRDKPWFLTSFGTDH